MKKFTLAGLLCLLLLTARAQYNDTGNAVRNTDTANKRVDSVFVPLKYRDIHKRIPVLACLFSIYIPGLVQVYNKKVLKGSIMFGTFCLSFTAAEIYHANNHSRPHDPVTAAILLPMATAYIYSVIDAPVTASWLNRAYHLGKKKQNLTLLSIEPGLINLSAKSYGPGVNLVFR